MSCSRCHRVGAKFNTVYGFHVKPISLACWSTSWYVVKITNADIIPELFLCVLLCLYVPLLSLKQYVGCVIIDYVHFISPSLMHGIRVQIYPNVPMTGYPRAPDYRNWCCYGDLDQSILTRKVHVYGHARDPSAKESHLIHDMVPVLCVTYFCFYCFGGKTVERITKIWSRFSTSVT